MNVGPAAPGQITTRKAGQSRSNRRVTPKSETGLMWRIIGERPTRRFWSQIVRHADEPSTWIHKRNGVRELLNVEDIGLRLA